MQDILHNQNQAIPQNNMQARINEFLISLIIYNTSLLTI